MHLIAAVFPLVPAWRLDRTFDYAVPESLAGRVEIGSLVRVPLGGRNVRGIVSDVRDEEPATELADIIAEIKGLVVEQPLVPPPIDRLYEWVATRYLAPRGTVLKRAVPPRVRVAVSEPPMLAGGPEPERARAYEGGRDVLAALESGRGGTWMWRTLPGEDRGALAAELVAAAGRGKGSALVGVPEVAHGSLVIDALTKWWPDSARVDSAVAEPDRARGWLQLTRGGRLGAGGRGIVFAPSPDVRLILLDDEHHPSYKEDRTPRFDARRVAVERARLQGAVCVLASATPSIEVAAAAAEGAFGSVAPARADLKKARTIVEILDRPQDRVLHPQTHARLSDALRRSERVALLAPRRGYSYLWCASCRRSLRCERCEAGVFFDRPRGGRVRCPRCGLEGNVPARCPGCGADDWRFVGAGSERLEEQIAAAWPRAKVVRVDPDSAPGRDEVADADIYLTTWIGTKPEVRPPVSLVAVLDADALIRVPDFRAAEHAYQALAAMAEWAGPAAAGGRLVVQASEPGHHALQAVVRADYDYFLRHELAHRAELAYPPYSELIKVTASGAARAEVVDAAAHVCAEHGATVLGPISIVRPGIEPASSLPSVPGRPALQLLAKCRDASTVAASLRDILPRVPRGTRLTIDVDPR